MPISLRIDPRLRALYLIAVAVGVFFLPAWWMVAPVALVQLALWPAAGLGWRQLGRQMRKLVLLLVLILVAYALVGEDPRSDRWHTVDVLGLDIDINLTGALLGLTMILRIVTIVLASQVIRGGDPRALAAGLGKLGVPRIAALSIDATLALLGDHGGHGSGMGGGGGGRGGGGGGGGRGGGGGGGGGRGGGGGGGGRSATGFWQGMKRLARGDVSILVDRLSSHVARVEAHLQRSTHAEPDQASSTQAHPAHPGSAPSAAMARDVAVISGIALTMLGIKVLKLLPGLPFAPGHKGVLLIPLYIVAGFMTRSRAGATWTGLVMGTVAFLLGDGRYGVFEIIKHVAPGVLVDLALPLLNRGPGAARRGILAWSLFGMLVALGRFATITAIALAVQAPALVYAVLVPGLVVHVVFGALSGIVTAPLVRALLPAMGPAALASPAAPAANTTHDTPADLHPDQTP